jgi:hypothetical protein
MIHSFIKGANNKNQEYLFYCINRLLDAKWPPKQGNLAEIEFMLSWPCYLPLLELNNAHSRERDYSKPLDDSHERRYQESILYLVKVVENVVSGSERLATIELLERKLDQLNRLVQYVTNEPRMSIKSTFTNPVNMKHLSLLIQVRKKECNEFYTYKENMKAFVQFCVKFPLVDVDFYQKQLKELKSFATRGIGACLDLSQVCQVKEFAPTEWNLLKDHFSVLKDYKPDVTYFSNVSKELMAIVEKIIALDRERCVIFDLYFAESCETICKNLNVERLSIQQVQKFIKFTHKVQKFVVFSRFFEDKFFSKFWTLKILRKRAVTDLNFLPVGDFCGLIESKIF